MADNVGDLDDELPLSQERGVNPQMVPHEDDVFHLGLEVVGVPSRRGVHLHPFRADGEAGPLVALLHRHGEGLDDFSRHLHMADIRTPFHDAALELVVFAYEIGHKGPLRLFVEGLRRRDLLHSPIVHHRHPVRQRQGLALVVGDIHHGGLKALLQAADLVLHLFPQAPVQGPQGFVHEDQVRFKHQGAGDGDPLLLAAGELGRAAFGKVPQLHHVQGPDDAVRDGFLGNAARLQGKGEILGDGHVRKQRVVLEDHADVALVRLDLLDGTALQPDLAAGGALKARQHLQAGGLAGPGGAQQGDELAPGDVYVEVRDRERFAVVTFVNLLEFNEGRLIAVGHRNRPGVT